MYTRNTVFRIAVILLFLISPAFVKAQSCGVINASPRTFNFSANGGSGTVFVSASPSNCTGYAMLQIGTFFTAYKYSEGISITCDENTTLFTRTGRLELDGSIIIQINQAAACPPQNPPGPITGNSTACQMASSTYTTTSVSGANSYVWTVSSGTVASGQGTLSAVIQFSSGSSATVSVAAKNSCNNQSTSQTFPVTLVSNPSSPTWLPHNPALCVGNNYTFGVDPVGGLTHEWSVEGTGFQILGGDGTASVNLQIGSGTGTLKVKAVNSTGCKSQEITKQIIGEGGSLAFNVSGNGSICPGESATMYLDSSVVNTTYTVKYNGGPVTGEDPSAVIVLSGNNSLLTFGPFTKEGVYTIAATDGTGSCPVPMNGSVEIVFKPAVPDQPGAVIPSLNTVCVNTGAGFTIEAVPRATSYTWTAVGGTIVSGQGTANAQIIFNSSGSGILVSVTAENECGPSAASTIPIDVIARPSAPSDISFNPSMCIGENYTFSVIPQSGLSYDWEVGGTNFLLLDGNGTSSINVQVGSGMGTISVKAINSTGCENTAYSEQISGEATSQAFNVSGDGNICPGTSATIHLDASAVNHSYTVYYNDGPVTGESPSAVITQSGNNSPLTFGPFTKEGTYTIKADASGNCPVPMNGSVVISFKPTPPDQPGAIIGLSSPVCSGANVPYSVLDVPRAESYIWSVNGGEIITGQGSGSVQVHFSTTGVAAQVSVVASNSCGNSSPSLKDISITHLTPPVFLPAYPDPCFGGQYTYAVEPVAGNSYTWDVSDEDWTIIGGQGTSSVGIKPGFYDATIKVKANKNGCSSTEASLPIDAMSPPGVFGLNGTQTICEGSTYMLGLSGSAAGYDYVLMRGETTITTQSGTGGPLTFGPYTESGTYKVYSDLAGSCPYPMDGEATITIQTLSFAPTSVGVSASEVCVTNNEEVILTANGGILGNGATYKWYTGTCGGNLIGTGSRIAVKPSATTSYYVRAEGVCNTTSCASVQINVASNCPDRRSFNYVRVRHPQESGYYTLPVEAEVEDIRTDFSYFDGLGRTSQQISKEGSPLKSDILSIKTYDKFGREEFSYLPASVAGNLGMPVEDASTIIEDFYSATGVSHPAGVAETSLPFAKTVFQPSPLNRVIKQGSPGVAWKPDEDDDSYDSEDHTIKMAYETNDEEEVLLWIYTPPTSAYPLGLISTGTGSAPDYYAANELFKTKTKDEQHNEVVEYKDKLDRVVLKQVQAPDDEWAQTYYVYDDFGNLVVVIPPEAVKQMGDLFIED